MQKPSEKLLFKVTLQDFRLGVSYVVAGNPAEAYRTVRLDLDERDIGTTKGRELKTIELIADDSLYPDCDVRLYL